MKLLLLNGKYIASVISIILIFYHKVVHVFLEDTIFPKSQNISERHKVVHLPIS